uniref:Fibronectin type-III domain-containing protein n=1 Tax=Scleropages formosus TaxID=113540 RepID=A0A8C9UY71_SCLFO
MVFVCLLYWKTGRSISITCAGVLQVDAGPIVLMGSDLNVLCRSEKERCGRHFSVYLNQLAQTPLKVLNCSAVMLHLTDIRTPTLELKCIVSEDGHKRTVCGKNFRSGYPPDKPTNFRCFGPRDSENMSCIWDKGKETHIPTSYNVTFKNSENRTYNFHERSHDAAQLHVPWSVFGVSGECAVDVTARNGLGESVSDTFLLSAKDVEIPSTPKIISVDFKNNSAVLRWQSSEPSVMLGKVRLGVTRDGMTSWDDRNGSDASRGELILDGLQPQTQYEFQIQSCTQGERPKCSLWSPAVQRMSPGIAPSRKLDVWRILESTQDKRVQNVTVLWKPLAYEEYSGVLVCYKLMYEQHGLKKTVSCAANVTECTIKLPRGVNALLVSAVTSAGSSPPSALTLRQTGLPGPQVSRLAPAGNNGVFLAWVVHADKSASIVCYIAQWQSTSLDLQWKRLPAEQNSTYIEGLKPGFRFHISLYSVTSSGSSYPVSAWVYSKEEPPLSGPKVSIKAAEESRILIRWEELELHQQRGFIANYTVHIRKCASGQHLQKVTFEGPQAGQRWLDKPATSFVLHVSASNSAGEGPEGEGVLYQCPGLPGYLQDSPEGGFSIKVCLAITIPLFILANLMYWKCFRRRVKMTCINLGPRWLFEKFPKVENSNVTRMLQENYSYSSCSSVYSDPPITPVKDVPTSEQTRLHSTVSRESSCDKGVAETTLQEKVVLYQDSGYKPQITPFTPEEDILESEDSLITGDLICDMETPEFQRHWPWGVSEDRCSPGLRTRIRPTLNPSDERALAPKQESLVDFNSFLEETRYGQTLLPDDLVSCLMGLKLKPAGSTSYFPQGLFGTEDHS